jgi:hypothetical protein
MNKKLIKHFAIMGIVPAIAFANPLAKFSDPLCTNEPLYGHGMPTRLDILGLSLACNYRRIYMASI